MNRIVEAHVVRLTVEGRTFYPWYSAERVEVRRSKTRAHIYLPDGTTLRKVKGGGCGGNYACVETGDVYRVSTK